MRRLTPIFNCSNDMALAANVEQYIPPKRIAQMEEDLCDLAKYWESGPWGWSLDTRQRYIRMGIEKCDLPSREWLDEVRQLSSREYACRYIKEMLKELKDERLVGKEMVFERGIRTVDSSIPWILKSPWSSSGRGVFTSMGMSREQLEHRLQGFLNSQGGYAVDRFYDKRLDFAMEFMVNDDHSVDFIGYSVFHAEINGNYGYNLVESQENLKERIGVDEDLLERTIEYHKQYLGKTAYVGPVGIDMMRLKPQMVNGETVNGTYIHPCIEINLRMNMGILAILLYNRYGENANVQLTPKREHGFEALIDNGKLMIIYKK